MLPALIIWLYEIMLYGKEILALIFLPILAGVLYLLDIGSLGISVVTRQM